MGIGYIGIAIGARRGVCNTIVLWGINMMGRIVLSHLSVPRGICRRISELRKAFGLESLWVKRMGVVWIEDRRRGRKGHWGCTVVGVVGCHVVLRGDLGHVGIGGEIRGVVEEFSVVFIGSGPTALCDK